MFLLLLFMVGFASVMGAENYIEEKPTNILGKGFKYNAETSKEIPEAAVADSVLDGLDSGDNNLYNFDYKRNNVKYNYNALYNFDYKNNYVNYDKIKRLIRQAREATTVTADIVTADIFPMKCPRNRIRVGWKCIIKGQKH